jgi:hypothetical protein
MALGALPVIWSLMGQTALAQAISPPVQLPPRACLATQLSANFVTAEGAAGTLFDTLALVNSSGYACILNGYPTVQMLDGVGNPLPTVDRPGGGMLGGRPGPSAFVLAPGAASQFVIAWSDVPVGTETVCAAASSLAITPPGASAPVVLDLPPPQVAPCDSGRIDVSPLRAPGQPVP